MTAMVRYCSRRGRTRDLSTLGLSVIGSRGCDCTLPTASANAGGILGSVPSFIRCLQSRIMEGILHSADDEASQRCHEAVNLVDTLNFYLPGNTTPLLAALKRHRKTPCFGLVSFLLEGGANCDFADGSGLCACLYGAAYKMEDVLRLMGSAAARCVHRSSLSSELLT